MTCRVCLDRGRVRVLPAGEPSHGHAMWMDCPECTTPAEVILLQLKLRRAYLFGFIVGFIAGLPVIPVVWL